MEAFAGRSSIIPFGHSDRRRLAEATVRRFRRAPASVNCISMLYPGFPRADCAFQSSARSHATHFFGCTCLLLWCVLYNGALLPAPVCCTSQGLSRAAYMSYLLSMYQAVGSAARQLDSALTPTMSKLTCAAALGCAQAAAAPPGGASRLARQLLAAGYQASLPCCQLDDQREFLTDVPLRSLQAAASSLPTACKLSLPPLPSRHNSTPPTAGPLAHGSTNEQLAAREGSLGSLTAWQASWRCRMARFMLLVGWVQASAGAGLSARC